MTMPLLFHGGFYRVYKTMVVGQRYEIAALLPAAGQSRRLAPMSCSKELFPIRFGIVSGRKEPRSKKVVSHSLLECLREAGIRKGYIVIRQGKWDIADYWGDGSMLRTDLAYVVIADSGGSPDTIDRVYPFVKDNIDAFGFPEVERRVVRQHV